MSFHQVARETDTINTGHSCDTTSTLLVQAQWGNVNNVFANNLGVSCLGDPVTPHTYPEPIVCVDCPDPVTEEANNVNVYVNNIPVCILGNDVDQNAGMGVITSGSPNVFITTATP